MVDMVVGVSVWFVVVTWDFDDIINSLEQHAQTSFLAASLQYYSVSHPNAEVICVSITLANDQKFLANNNNNNNIN